MLFAGCNISAKWVRLVSLVLCFALVLSSLPVHFKRNNVSAQSSGGAGLKRQLPPNYKLPNINSLLTEGKKLQRPTLPRPALKPSTICGFRDEACKRKKEKEKKVSRNFAPSNDNAVQVLDDVARKSGGAWLGRLGRAFSNVLSGFTSVSAKGNSFLASDSNRSAGSPAPPVLNNTTTGAALALPPPSFTSIGAAKLDPRYRVGGAGEDLFSGNYNISLPLVSLPGRAGLDLNITLSYNSLIWIKHSGRMEFDYDYYATLTPGFRTGFPEIEPPFWSNGYLTYVVYLPSGRRVEMRQAGTNRFEAIDSSYLYLTVNPTDSTKLTLYSTDGTQYKFEWPNATSGPRCTQIKDSNGNYITIAYKGIGDPEFPATVIDKVTDTLGRDIVFNYDGNLHLLSITQNRDGQTFYWAQFDYGTKYVAPNFGSLTVYGPNNTNIPVITRVVTGGGARHTFSYNSWGQVDNISTYGEADNHLASMIYAFPSTATSQSDCPRFTQRNDGIFAWPGEVYDPQTGFGWGINYFYFEPNEAYGQVTGPDAVTRREIFSTSGNTRGLTTRTETHHGGAIQQFTDLTWLSDSAASPPLRPRVSEIRICDDRNHDGYYQPGTDKLRMTTIEYSSYASTIKLPWIVKEYNEGGGSVYRSTETYYVASGNYINNNPNPGVTRRIIGLPSFRYLYEGNQTKLVGQTEYVYDSVETGFLQGYASVRQHDTSTYGTGFPHRGNLTKVRRYSVDESGTAGGFIESKTGYYVTGNVALTKIARDGQTNIETNIYYDDSFSNGVAPNPPTYAYPTKVKDPDNFYSAVKYNYDFGAVTESVDAKNYAISPTNPPVKTIRTYDTKGRLDKAAVWKDGVEYSHIRYVYSTGHDWAQTWTTVNSLAEETSVLHLLDGVGRERIVMKDHPSSQGGRSSYYRVFDKMGRVAEWSRPTEINSSTWAPTGDDSAYIAGSQTFDWKGRPKTTTNFDGTTKTINYTGCGCAGSDVTELIDETGRKQEIYRDVFGRAEKAESLDSGGGVYLTQANSYNIRDQITQVSQIAGTSGASQITTRQYDGYGRLWKSRSPIESGDTIYEYNDDDTVRKVTDARQAAATFTYYGRRLVQDIVYTVPAGVAATPNVHYAYDGNGNRNLMNDGLGTITYAYDELSRMTSETRQFTATFGEYHPALSGTYKLTYDYNLAGQVKRISFESSAYPGDNSSTYYDYNKVGEMVAVTGSPYAGVTQYQTEMKYRAWGSLKSASYGNGLTLSASYTARQQLQQFEIAKAGSPIFMKSEYWYNDDGRIKYAKDFGDDKFDRAYSYDHIGRLQEAYSGTQARDFINQTNTTPVTAPYRQTYQYDVWSNMTSSNGRFWTENYNYSFSATYNNGRRQGWEYDEAGNLTSDGQNLFSYDAAGRNISVVGENTEATQAVDGDGVVVWQGGNYHLHSTVLGGQVIVVIHGFSYPGSYPFGKKTGGGVYAGSTRVAGQHFSSTPEVTWYHDNPVTHSEGGSIASGYFYRTTERDPSGGHVGLIPWSEAPPTTSSPDTTISLDEPAGGGLGSPKFLLDGVEVPWAIGASLIKQGAAVVAPAETTRWNYKTGQFEFFRAYADGMQGWAGFNYIPGGGVRLYANNRDGSRGPLLSIIGEGPDSDFHPDQGQQVGGQYPQYPHTAEGLKNWAIENYGKKFEDCLKSLTQEYINKQPRNKRAGLLAKLKNLKPFSLSSVNIDTSLTQEEVVQKYHPALLRDGKFDPVKTQFVGGVPDGGKNSVVIPKELFNKDFEWEQWKGAIVNISNMGNTFIHESGNLSAYYLFGDYNAFADPKSLHPDSGDAMGRCVFGYVFPPIQKQ